MKRPSKLGLRRWYHGTSARVFRVKLLHTFAVECLGLLVQLGKARLFRVRRLFNFVVVRNYEDTGFQ